MAVGANRFGRKEAPGYLRQAGAKPKGALTALFGRLLRTSRFDNDNPPQLPEAYEPATELDCLINVLPSDLLRKAAQRSHEVGTGADQVLIRRGLIGEGLVFETFAEVRREDCPLADDKLASCAHHGLIPINRNGEQRFIYAPRNYTARRIANLTRRFPVPKGRIGLTSAAHLDEFLERHTGGVLAHDAAEGLADRFPDLSAAPAPLWRSPFESFMRSFAHHVAFIVPFVLFPELIVEICSVVLAFWFLLFTSLRLAGR
jgi:hypothetical protein